MSKRIYLDYASLTPIDRRVLREMRRYSGSEYANPSSIYKEGVAARTALQEARKLVGSLIHAHADEVVFTAGGTEANNLALEGVYRAARRAGITRPNLIISSIEHSSIMEAASRIEEQGAEVTRLPVGDDCIIDAEALRREIKPETFMVSVMGVNNETGLTQSIRDVAKSVRWARTHTTKSSYPLIHTDACQAALCYDLNVEQLGIDLMTLDGSKIYGPRGFGALYVRRGTPIESIISGGGQEKGIRSGTENIPAAKGFALALDIADKERSKEFARLSAIKECFLEGLKALYPDLSVNGDQSVVSPHILNVSIPGIDNEFFVLQLDAKGVAVSTKSSCLRDVEESYVLRAIGADSRTAVRFSFGRQTTPRDTARALKIIAMLAKRRPF